MERKGLNGAAVKKLLVIVGPTATGKTRLSLEIAARTGAEIISADSRQIYRHLNIGTSKPSPEELREVHHHFIDILEPNQPYSAGVFGKAARETVDDLNRRDVPGIVVGGSGLYIRALIDGLFDGPGADEDVRRSLEMKLKQEGLAALLEALREVDPVSAENMKGEPKARRIIRALEVYYRTGVPLSRHHAGQSEGNRREAVQIGLAWDREALYRRINERAADMVRNGLVEEVRWLLERFDRQLNSLNTVGYKETIEYLDRTRGLQETLKLIQQNTRRFAKRQLTWFRADQRIRWVPVAENNDWGEIASKVLSLMEE